MACIDIPMPPAKNIILLTCIISICTIFHLPAQIPDSIGRRLDTIVSSTQRAKILNQLSYQYRLSHPEQAEILANKALEMAEISDDMTEKTKALMNLARAKSTLNAYDSVLIIIHQAKEILKSLDNPILEGEALLIEGYALKETQNFNKAFKEFHKAVDIFIDENFYEGLTKAYNQIGGIYYDRSDLERAATYFIKSLSITQKTNNQENMAAALNNVGEIYRLNKNFKIALQYYHRAIRINRETFNNYYLIINLDNVGNIYLETNKLDSALIYLNESLALAESLHIPRLIITSGNSLADYYFVIKQYEKAKALYYSAYQLASISGPLAGLREATKGLSDVSVTTGNFKDGWIYLNEYKRLNDSLLNTESIKQITRHELSLKYENENRVLASKRRQSGLVYFFIGSAIIAMLLIIILLYGRQKIKIKYSLLEKERIATEQSLLQAEMDHKNRELTTGIMYLVKKNELINYVTEKLIKGKIHFKKENQYKINDIILEFQSMTSDNIWLLFEKKFSEVHSDFFNLLAIRFPKLTEKDKKLCALLRLNLTSKEIASITHQNLNSIQVSRTRLRKKLGIDNSNETLYGFLSSL
ncbi:MAG: tetratricopeptide repeat protein [Bacteroidales bacterium]|nr:tetratricopeptide repeat protein [Bacteroidales bacterium]